MKNKKIAVFICCNKEYHKYAITTLLSYKRFRPEWDYFIISETKCEKAKYYDIKSIVKNFSHLWNDSGCSRKNIELKDFLYCWWHLSAQQFFKDMEYDLSLTVDADTFCIEDPYPNFEHFDWAMAAVRNSGANKKIPQELQNIKELTLTTEAYHYAHLHSAVVWYNHSFVGKEFTNECIKMYNSLKTKITLKGDQHLLMIFIPNFLNKYPFYLLDPKFNFFFKCSDVPECVRIFNIDVAPLPVSIVHFQGINCNPWNKVGLETTGIKKYYIQEWRDFYRSVWNSECPIR